LTTSDSHAGGTAAHVLMGYPGMEESCQLLWIQQTISRYLGSLDIGMNLAAKFGLGIALVWTAMSGFAIAGSARHSEAPEHASSPAGARSWLSVKQGEALVDFAVESAADLRDKPDCSHFVHLVYSDAGLNYGYQNSRVLYRGGAREFQRVKKPQPGDLIVWTGHVGIVVSRKEKTFFSSVRSGILMESWTAGHWIARGRPHFFRYRIGPATDLTLLASMNGEDNGTPKQRPRLNRIDARDAITTPDGPGESEDTESSESDRHPPHLP
jgi:NlpC/P60 family